MKYIVTLIVACAALFTVAQVEARHHRCSSFSLSFGAFAPAPVCPTYVVQPQPCYYAPVPSPYYVYPAPTYVYARPAPVIGTSTTFGWYNCR